MSAAAPAVMVMAAPASSALVELLGADRASSLEAALGKEAERWAAAVSPGAVLADDRPVAAASERALDRRDGPLVVIWPVLARFRTEHAAGALGDLEAGADLSIGPLTDGGVYLLAMSRPLAEILSVPDAAWIGSGGVAAGLQGAAESGREVGLLRAERALRRTSDVRAAVADPLTPPDIGQILRG